MKGDMTRGNTTRILIKFAIPLLLGNLFQQLYNTTDAIIVGRYIGKNALAAVGVANPIMSVAIFFIFGICIGTSVLMAQLFGAGKYDELKKEVSTSLIAGIIFTIALSIVCILLSRWMLIITGTPEEILDDADIFLKIIFGGLIFSFLYNFYSSSLRAIGDSNTPLIFLIISCVLNAVLCIVFVAGFKLGVAGSAIATVIAQGISSLLCVAYVYTRIPLLSLKKDELVVEKDLLKLSLQYSWVTALQQTCIYIGKLMVQGVVNPFGTNAIAAYNSVTRIDSFVMAGGESLSASVATYSAQNKGAGKTDRIMEGFKKSAAIMAVYSIIIGLAIYFKAEGIMKLFVSADEKEVISIGIGYLKAISFFYMLSNINNVFQGLFRGIGKLRITFFATFIQIIIRVALSYILAPHFGIASVCYAIAAGWVVMLVYEMLSYRKYFKEIKDEERATI
ncbi:MATE family efflux transporter [Lutispora saccharofermentans]|uniref:Probable multidrug resistance protein NorM n=1 Tax=Lutispora saccharofermentans TaxID=3024236 RepID=A0ABT1NMN8_9FIRM|nr:MATE family efflux transporter [Lutispora saccharofermentans]MCQ1531196.1 MATE family efflux transporter [Lutispora saccharofermentans]